MPSLYADGDSIKIIRRWSIFAYFAPAAAASVAVGSIKAVF